MSGPVPHLCQVPSKYSKGYSSYRADTKSFSNKTKNDNSKSKKARVVNLVCDTSSHPDLHFYQVSSKYSSYRADKKFYTDALFQRQGISGFSRTRVKKNLDTLFVLRFYSPVNPMGSCRAWSVYLTTRLLGRLSPLSG